MKMKGVYIPSVEAKDLYISNNYITNNPVGYGIRRKDGELNQKKFKNVLDYSLDLIKLREIYEKKYRRKDFGLVYNGKEYSYQVINVTFKYACREWNRLGQKYIKFGYNDEQLTYEDGTARNESGEVVGVDLSVEVTTPTELQYFKCIDGHYALIKDPPVLKTRAELREEMYKNGFVCNGLQYVRMKRSAGSARVGKCLFINEKLYKPLHKWELGGIKVKHGQEIDLAALESYISLSTSSIIDTLEIQPENILIIDDYDSVFKENVVATQIANGHLESKEQEIEISNSIWDGQSLLDISLFTEKYEKKGMLLLRNLMFKSCCFNANIQSWFRDNGITDVSQLNGYTRATDISQVKLITTPNSIKYLKFGTLDEWLDNIGINFGVVKYDKPTHYFEGRMVKTHYQLLNTLELSYQDMEEFLAPSLDFIQKLKDNPAVVREFIHYPRDKEVEDIEMATKNDVVYNLMCVNDDFTKTKYYYDFLVDLIKSQYKELRNGHVLVNGNYSTMVGNPIEMLLASIGKFDGTSQLGKGNIHSKRFEYGKTILGSRSPHVAMGNVALFTNVSNLKCDKYLNMTKQIIAMNAIGENTLERLSGSDYDSDILMITDNSILINAAQKNYHTFATPTNLVDSSKTKRYYTPEQLCDLDVKTSVNKIGEIVNLSQVLNSVYWDKLHHGATHNELHDLYCDIATLDVLSCLQIDAAKKEFAIDMVEELNIVRNKYSDLLTTEDNKKILPNFFAHVARQKGYYDPKHKAYLQHDTSMDYLQTIVRRFKTKSKIAKPTSRLIDIFDMSNYHSWRINHKQISHIMKYVKWYSLQISSLFSDIYYYETENVNEYDVSRYEKYQILQSELISEINKYRIGYSTMIFIIEQLERKDYYKYRNILLPLLLTVCGQSFIDAVIKSQADIDVLVEGGNDIFLYDFGYNIMKNASFLTKKT